MNDDDIILPDDFVDTPTAEPEVETQDTDFELDAEPNAEDTKPADEPVEPQEPVPQPQKLKIKYNHQEMELDPEEAAPLVQKGLNYEKAVERAKQEARDAVIADMGYTDFEGKPITTEARYREVLQEKEIRDKYADLPDELRQELIASRRDREERAREKAAKEQEAQNLAKWNEFFDYFEEVNERPFDAKKDTMPAEVDEAIKAGQSPLQAYMKHHAKELRNRLKITQQNQENTRRAPVGSVTAGGGKPAVSEDPFLKGFDSVFY